MKSNPVKPLRQTVSMPKGKECFVAGFAQTGKQG